MRHMCRDGPNESGPVWPDKKLCELLTKRISLYVAGSECKDFTKAMRKEHKKPVILKWENRNVGGRTQQTLTQSFHTMRVADADSNVLETSGNAPA